MFLFFSSRTHKFARMASWLFSASASANHSSAVWTVPLGRLQKPAGAEMEDRLSSPTRTRSSLSLCEWRHCCSVSLGARKALGSKLSLGNLTIFCDLIQRPFTNWKRFRWTIWGWEHGTRMQPESAGRWHPPARPPRGGTWRRLPGWAAASRGPASWWPAGASCTLSSSRARPPPAPPRWWRPSDSCPGWWAQPGPGETAPHCSAPPQSAGRPALGH